MYARRTQRRRFHSSHERRDDLGSPASGPSRQPTHVSEPRPSPPHVSGASRVRPPPRKSALKTFKTKQHAAWGRKVRSPLIGGVGPAKATSLRNGAGRERQRVRFTGVMLLKERAPRMADVLDGLEAMAVEDDGPGLSSAALFSNRYPSPISSSTSCCSRSPPPSLPMLDHSGSEVDQNETLWDSLLSKSCGRDYYGERAGDFSASSDVELPTLQTGFRRTFAGSHRGSPPPF
jgi:hypothetical protein